MARIGSSVFWTILGITLGSIIVSGGLAELTAMFAGIELGWKQHLVAIVVPGIVTPLWALPLVRSNRRLNRMTLELETLARTDPLSGLPNRRAFFERAGRIFLRAGVAPLAVMMIDIDDFKSINDGYGHDVGDAVIHAVAAIIARAADHANLEKVVARLGGEEFAVVLAGCPQPIAAEIADRICTGVHEARWYGSDTGECLTVSIGFALREEGETLKTVLKAADRAVYDAKRRGRDRWSCASTSLESNEVDMLRIDDAIDAFRRATGQSSAEPAPERRPALTVRSA